MSPRRPKYYFPPLELPDYRGQQVDVVTSPAGNPGFGTMVGEEWLTTDTYPALCRLIDEYMKENSSANLQAR